MGAPRSKRVGGSGGSSEVTSAIRGLSRKSIRLLEQAGVIEGLAGRSVVVVTGPTAQVEGSGDFARLGFWIDEKRRLNVGIATGEGPQGPWVPSRDDWEPFTLRSYGYFRRYVQRMRRHRGE